MAKTLQSLIAEAKELSDEEFDNAQWVEWLNSGLDDIAPILYIDDKVTIAKVADAFPVPADYLQALRLDGVDKNLQMLPIYDDTSTGYKIIADNFILQNDTATEIVLYYYKVPSYFSTSAMTSPISTRIESATRALVFYACAMGMAREDEGDRHDLYMSQYTSAKVSIQQKNTKKRPGRVGTWGVVR